ncbi:MAG: hypothetical protein IKP12_04140 [Acholeplasmatales bacterium]|nr:hypothetical protein [Acholeplasmatales bacterium]
MSSKYYIDLKPFYLIYAVLPLLLSTYLYIIRTYARETIESYDYVNLGFSIADRTYKLF